MDEKYAMRVILYGNLPIFIVVVGIIIIIGFLSIRRNLKKTRENSDEIYTALGEIAQYLYRIEDLLKKQEFHQTLIQQYVDEIKDNQMKSENKKEEQGNG